MKLLGTSRFIIQMPTMMIPKAVNIRRECFSDARIIRP